MNLSSWAEKQQSLSEWIQESLLHDYQVPRKVGQKWVQSDYQLALLLDGLDEVKKELREVCVDAINMFRSDYMMDIVVCCRTLDYEDLNTQVNIATAVELRTLSSDQIDEYLSTGGQSLIPLRQAIKEDASLQALGA